MKTPDLHNPQMRHEPFTTPEGYFESLTQSLMEQLPAQPSQAEPAAPQGGEMLKKPFWKTDLYAKVKPYIYMAAMLSGLYFGVWVYKYQQRLIGEKAQMAQSAVVQPQELDSDMSAQEIKEYINDACDYMMASGHDIMACVTETE